MKTLFILKPDAYERQLDREIKKILSVNFTIEETGSVQFTPESVAEFYSHLRDKPLVMQQLQEFMTQRPVEYFVASGEDAISRGRNLVGATNPLEAHPESIRGRFNDGSGNKTRNLIHASDSEESFEREYRIVKSLKCC